MKDVKKTFVIVMTSIFATIIFGVVFFSVVYNPNDEVNATPALAQIEEDQSLISGHPVRFYIPVLNIDANVQEVGITEKGNIATPRNFSSVGWYKYGILPGKNGTAVIDGHVDNGLAFPAVFSNLKNIKIGDNIYVETKENEMLNFVVENIDVYDYDSSTKDIIKNSDIPHLVLITCTGNWIPNLRTHDKRLVVTTTLANQQEQQ